MELRRFGRARETGTYGVYVVLEDVGSQSVCDHHRIPFSGKIVLEFSSQGKGQPPSAADGRCTAPSQLEEFLNAANVGKTKQGWREVQRQLTACQ